jgi:uncharacterized protein involved in response to NO
VKARAQSGSNVLKSVVASGAAPLWRREPYRLLFAEAFLLAWAGVLVWPLYALAAADYRSEFHAITQIEGFLGCIAVGFLFTFIPRRTGTAAASRLQIVVAMLASAVVSAAAWADAVTLSQAAWLTLVAVVFAFAVPRLLAPGAGLTLPNAIVWVPAGLLFGAAGAVLLVWGDVAEAPLVRVAGHGLLFQGMLSAFVAGIGATLLPVLTRGLPHAESAGTRRDAAVKALHGIGAAVLAASFLVELAWSVRIGYALRAAVILTALIGSARIHRPPTVPGLHRRLVWLAAWLLPLGFALAAAFPAHEQAALHVSFIGGFALMALSVAYHVALAHGGRPGLLSRRPRRVAAMGVLLLVALVLRAIAELHPGRAELLLGIAAAVFLAGTLCWATLVLPRLLDVSPDGRG